VARNAWRPRVNRKAVTWLCGVVLTLLAIIGLAQTLGITINSSPSMPIGIWRVAPIRRPVRVGDIVITCLPISVAALGIERGYIERGACPNGSAPIIKFVAAAAGDTVKVNEGEISVDGTRLPNSRSAKRDQHGRQLARVALGTYHIGEGKLWLWTPYSGSWDSRYFGEVAISDVRSFAYLLYEGAPPTFDFRATQHLLAHLHTRRLP
jgi:conjugative transfer signal peptidase TraF